MKVLIDPIYTGKAHKCSTSYLAWEIIEHLIEKREDAFFYLLYPEASEQSEEEMAFLRRHPDRVTLLPYPYIQADRVEEAFKLHDRLIHYISPGDTPIWDYDVVLTSRIPQIPFMRNMSGREGNFPKGTERLFIGLEEMPFFSFRDTVSWAPGGNMDLQSLASYQAADAIVVNNLWTKEEVQKIARQWLSPSRMLEVTRPIYEALPVKLTYLAQNKRGTKRPFNVVFAGRMTGTRNFKEVAELFRKHYSFPISKERDVKFIVTTNSASTGATNVGEIDFMEVQKNNREQFHTLLKEHADVVVNLSTVEDFSLSTYEPLLYGVPVIVPDRPWTSFLGRDYPFRAKDFTQAYAMVKAFVNDYEAQYHLFMDWRDSYWVSLVEGPRNVSTAEVVAKLIATHEVLITDKLESSEAGALYKNFIQELLDTGAEEVEPLKYAMGKDTFVTNAKQWRGIPVAKRPNQHLLKVYANMMGFRDTNVPGVMRRA